MPYTANPTNLSFAGYLKWILIIASIPFFMKAYQGLVKQESATGGGRSVGRLVTGSDAVAFGWQALGAGMVCLFVSWAIWFFWQRHEE